MTASQRGPNVHLMGNPAVCKKSTSDANSTNSTNNTNNTNGTNNTNDTSGTSGNAIVILASCKLDHPEKKIGEVQIAAIDM